MCKYCVCDATRGGAACLADLPLEAAACAATAATSAAVSRRSTGLPGSPLSWASWPSSSSHSRSATSSSSSHAVSASMSALCAAREARTSPSSSAAGASSSSVSRGRFRPEAAGRGPCLPTAKPVLWRRADVGATVYAKRGPASSVWETRSTAAGSLARARPGPASLVWKASPPCVGSSWDCIRSASTDCDASWPAPCAVCDMGGGGWVADSRRSCSDAGTSSRTAGLGGSWGLAPDAFGGDGDRILAREARPRRLGAAPWWSRRRGAAGDRAPGAPPRMAGRRTRRHVGD